MSRFGYEGWLCFLIASVPDLCILFTFRPYAADCMPSFNPIMGEGYAALFSCMVVVQVSDPMMPLT